MVAVYNQHMAVGLVLQTVVWQHGYWLAVVGDVGCIEDQWLLLVSIALQLVYAATQKASAVSQL